jgi:hypothetical protein
MTGEAISLNGNEIAGSLSGTGGDCYGGSGECPNATE